MAQPDSSPGVGGANSLRHYFDLTARRYADDVEPAFAPLVAGLVGFAGAPSGARVLDLGAGSGLVARALDGMSADVWSLDFSRRMLYVARQNGVLQVTQADMHALPFRDRVFSVVFGSFAFNSTDPLICLREARRVVEPGGRLVFQEWVAPDPLSEIVTDAIAGYAVDDPPPDLARLRAEVEQPVPWDDLESSDDIVDKVVEAGFEASLVEVVTEEVPLSLDEYVRYKLAWPSRGAEVAAMSDEVRQLMMSDLRENLTPHIGHDGLLIWRPEVIRIIATRPAD